jgi:hypothetical protein
MEGRLQAVDGAVDDTAVKAEQKAADGGNAADQDDEAGIFPVVCYCLYGWQSSTDDGKLRTPDAPARCYGGQPVTAAERIGIDGWVSNILFH